MVQQLQEKEENREIIACVTEGSDLEMKHKIRNYLTALQEWSGLDKGQVEYIDPWNQKSG